MVGSGAFFLDTRTNTGGVTYPAFGCLARRRISIGVGVPHTKVTVPSENAHFEFSRFRVCGVDFGTGKFVLHSM